MFKFFLINNLSPQNQNVKYNFVVMHLADVLSTVMLGYTI